MAPKGSRGSHGSRAKSHRYIDTLIKQPKGLSMVNSNIVTLATYSSRVPYSFGIGLNSLMTP
jgi:hypothetical protein